MGMCGPEKVRPKYSENQSVNTHTVYYVDTNITQTDCIKHKIKTAN